MSGPIAPQLDGKKRLVHLSRIRRPLGRVLALESIDGGKTWRGRNVGMTNDYLPKPGAEWGHNPRFITQCANDSDHVWQQNHCGVFYSRDGAQMEESQCTGPWHSFRVPGLGERRVLDHRREQSAPHLQRSLRVGFCDDDATVPPPTRRESSTKMPHLQS